MDKRAQHGFTLFGRSAEHGFTLFGRSAEHGFTLFGRSAEHGFTLIEMMVALAVFSLAALALIRLEGASLRGAATLDRAQLGAMVARNVAVDALTSARPPVLGTEQGSDTNGRRDWHWARTVAPLGDGNRVYRIDVVVSDALGTAATLTMVRDSPPAAPVPAARSTP